MGRSSRRAFGTVHQMQSGRWRARYRGPDGKRYAGHVTCLHKRDQRCDGYCVDGRSQTFDSRPRASDWLTRIDAAIQEGRWTSPVELRARARKSDTKTFRVYAENVIRERNVAVRSREHAEQLLRDHVYPTFGDVPVDEITPEAVRAWHARVCRADPAADDKRQRKDRPVARSHAYGTLRLVLQVAVADGLLPSNPCAIKGAGRAKTTKQPRPLTLDELAALTGKAPDRYQMMIQLALWCCLRFGEVTELRRHDVDLKHGVLRVRRAVTRTSAGLVVKTPKSAAGQRDVTIPSHLLDDLERHLKEHAQVGPDGLLFPPARGGSHLVPSSTYKWFYPARDAAGRPDLRFHDLRHTGATYAALAGASVRELQGRLGDSTIAAAMRYVHVVDTRPREIADNLAAFASGSNVTSLDARRERTAS